ncbi:MAG: NAD-dependent deacetylase [Betaproteobacteria bacterium]|nr:NAD-dependent deacetylase [Betaproteobacteria bacterium]
MAGADVFRRCARAILEADGLLVTAGAGLGVDSGLPDFRGTQGFWRAYPALGRAKIAFESIASPAAFESNARLAWGFYGHRLALYRRTVPHEGFALLKKIGASMPGGAFVFTSNVDGQFQTAGFDSERVCEIHGSIHHLQCMQGCSADIWPATEFAPEIDAENCLLRSSLPTCPRCGSLARPNILMFGDWGWIDSRTREQHEALQAWFGGIRRPVAIEVGAGTAIPSVRHFGEASHGTLIRINPTEPDVPSGKGFGLRMAGLEGIRGIAQSLFGEQTR